MDQLLLVVQLFAMCLWLICLPTTCGNYENNDVDPLPLPQVRNSDHSSNLLARSILWCTKWLNTRVYIASHIRTGIRSCHNFLIKAQFQTSLPISTGVCCSIHTGMGFWTWRDYGGTMLWLGINTFCFSHPNNSSRSFSPESFSSPLHTLSFSF